MVVQHNLTAMNANRYFGINNSKLSKSLEKLSSGYAINRAGDNAAGLAVSEKMRSQIGGLTQAVKNAQDGISMVQTYEGALTETDSILQRMKVLATQSANGSYDDPIDRNAIEQEFLQLNDELDQIADTDFNGVVVLNGGTMADGVSADANGLIDYKAAADAAAAEAAAAKAAKPVDMVADSDYVTKAPELDDSKYDQTKATALWTQAETDGYTAAADAKEINIKYVVDAVDADGNVTAVKGYYEDGTEYGGTITPTNNGGWADGVTGANIVLDTVGAKKGDFVTVNYTNPVGKEIEPTNIGFTDSNVDGTGITVDGDISLLTEDVAKATTIALNTDVSNTNWTGADKADYQDAIKALDGASLKIEYTTNADGDDLAAAVVKLTDSEGTEHTLTAGAATGWGVDALPDGSAKAFTLTFNGKNIADITPGALTMDGTDQDATGSMTFEISVDGYRTAGEEKPNAKLTKDVNAEATEEEYKVSQSNAFSKSEAKMTYKKSITLQVGSRTKDAVDFTFAYKSTSMGDLTADLNCTAAGLGTDKLTLSTQEDANYAIDKIDQAINKVSMVRGTFGAIQNRLEHKIDNLNVTTENLTSAESRIRDTNMAEEMMNFTKQQILSQASQSMLAQANQLPQGVLSLLQ
ncbi:MAG: flagellin [Oscillospiraceae bacterium]